MFDIVEYTWNSLKNLGVPVQYGWYDENIEDTHITFFCVSENDGEFVDNENSSEHYLMQIDIWSKEDTVELKDKVKSALKGADFCFKNSRDFIETDIRIYHKALRFEYVRMVK